MPRRSHNQPKIACHSSVTGHKMPVTLEGWIALAFPYIGPKTTDWMLDLLKWDKAKIEEFLFGESSLDSAWGSEEEFHEAVFSRIEDAWRKDRITAAVHTAEAAAEFEETLVVMPF